MTFDEFKEACELVSYCGPTPYKSTFDCVTVDDLVNRGADIMREHRGMPDLYLTFERWRYNFSPHINAILEKDNEL